MRIYFDTEFTGLHQNTTLISIGCVSDDDKTFYAESTEYNLAQVDDWLQQNVIGHLFGDVDAMSRADPRIDMCFRASEIMIAHGLRRWLSQWESVEMWSDCYAYDWVLFCNLFGGAFGIPENVYYIPFDLATLFKMKEIGRASCRERV